MSERSWKPYSPREAKRVALKLGWEVKNKTGGEMNFISPTGQWFCVADASSKRKYVPIDLARLLHAGELELKRRKKGR